MKRERVGWRDILRRLAEIPTLRDAERRRLDRILTTRRSEEEESVAREMLERLSAAGVLDRHEVSGSGRVTFSTSDGYRKFTVPAPVAGTVQHVQRYPRPLSRDIGAFPPETVRALLALQGQVVSLDKRVLAGPIEAIAQALECVHDLLEVDHASFRLAEPRERAVDDVETALPAPPVALPGEDEAVLRDNRLLSIPDLTLVPGGAATGFGTAALVRVGAEGTAFYGVLGAWSKKRGHFTRERLATLDLLADIASDLTAKAESLAQVVFIDQLTQLYNRTYFHLQTRKEIARAKRENASMVLCILDLDEFKRLNEYPYGYEGANQVIRQVADILKTQVRPFDSVARWGGEEYTLLLAAPMTREDALAICERLRRAVEAATFTLTGLDGGAHEVRATLSAGAAVYPQDGASPEELWRHANEALLVAKQPPKNAVVFWSAAAAEKGAGPNGPPRPSHAPRKPAPRSEPSPAPPSPPGSRPRATSPREGS